MQTEIERHKTKTPRSRILSLQHSTDSTNQTFAEINGRFQITSWHLQPYEIICCCREATGYSYLAKSLLWLPDQRQLELDNLAADGWVLVYARVQQDGNMIAYLEKKADAAD